MFVCLSGWNVKNLSFMGTYKQVTLPETNSSPLKIGHPKRKLVFQPSIFRCYVSFREGIYLGVISQLKRSKSCRLLDRVENIAIHPSEHNIGGAFTKLFSKSRWLFF